MTRRPRPTPKAPSLLRACAAAALLAACGDGGSANAPPDAAPQDLAPDVAPKDAAPDDAPPDAGPDVAPLDAAPKDAPPPDAAEDAAPDVAPMDAAPDVAPDAAEDAAPDAAEDAAPDVAPTDAAPDAPARCGGDDDCAASPDGPVCDATSGRCVRCLPTRDRCPAGQYCAADSNTCADGCRDDAACAAGDGGAARCDPATRRCVACLASADCPLGQLCRAGACAPGCDDTHACPAGRSCCTGACVDTLNDTASCGACGTACATPPHAAATCAAGRCGLACTAGFGDCDADGSNGCEVDLAASAPHCGACGRACAPAHATGACTAGACAVAACAAGFGDCDGAAANGCEVDLGASAAHCGRCGAACAAGSACVVGRCAPAVAVEGERNLSTTSVTPGRTCADAPSYGVDALTDGSATLAAAPGPCLAPGDLVLLISVQGAPGATANVGNHEVLTVDAVEGAVVRFRGAKTRRYGSGADDDANVGGGAGQQRVVLQRVPVFGDLTVRAGATLTVDAWDGRRGGVLALRAARLVVDGALTVSARGFRSGRYSVDDGSCSESLATERGESIEGPPAVTLAASAGASGGLGAASGVSFNGETPLTAGAGHAVPGEEGQYPNGRTLGAPGGAYGSRDGSRVTLGSGAGGNVTCRGGSFAPMYGDPSTTAGGAVIVDADAISVGGTGAIDASASDGGRTPAAGGYVLLRANTVALNEGRVRAVGATGVADNRSGRRTNRAGDGYVSVRYRDALTGTSAPVATAARVAAP